MKTFFDSSAFAKRFVEEPGSSKVEDICGEARELAVSVICASEIVSALARRLREPELTRRQYLAAKRRLFEDLHDAVIVNLTPAVIRRCVSALEETSTSLRTLDALLVASAVEWQAELFVTSDRRQLAAADEAGLTTVQV